MDKDIDRGKKRKSSALQIMIKTSEQHSSPDNVY